MRHLSVNREIKDVFYLIGLQGLNYIAPLLVLPYLMKILDADKFGYIGFSLAVTQYLMLIVDFGFNLSATKRVALAKDNKEELNRVFSSTIYAKIFLLAISFVVLLLLAFIPQFAIYRQTLFILFFMVVGNAFTFVWLFQGLGKIKIISIISSIAKLSILPLTFLLVKNPDDYLIAAVLQSLIVVVSALISVGYIVKKKMASLGKFSKNNVLDELKESFPIFLSGAASSIYVACFIVVLGYFATSQEVGQYSAVDRIMRALCYLVLTPVLQAFYPKVTCLGIEDRKAAVLMVRKLLVFVLVCMTAICIFLFFGSPVIVSFLGSSYSGATILFRIQSFVPIFVGVGGVIAQLGILAMGDGRDKKNYQRVYMIAGVVALTGVFIAAPLAGANGTAIALLITEIVVCALMYMYGRKYLSIKNE